MKNNRILGILLVGFILASAFSFSSCKKDKDEEPGANEVLIQGTGSDGFNPTSLTVSQGTTVTWINKQSVSHTVTSDNGLFDSGTMGKDSKFTYTFDSTGTFNYHCTFHAAMKASVTVQ